jgi:hypothetical protein
MITVGRPLKMSETAWRCLILCGPTTLATSCAAMLRAALHLFGHALWQKYESLEPPKHRCLPEALRPLMCPIYPALEGTLDRKFWATIWGSSCRAAGTPCDRRPGDRACLRAAVVSSVGLAVGVCALGTQLSRGAWFRSPSAPLRGGGRGARSSRRPRCGGSLAGGDRGHRTPRG